MTARRPWVLSLGRRPVLPFLLALVAGGATAGFAGYYVHAAWSGFVNCPSGSGSGCAPHPFWGLPPELYLIACVLGIGAGVLTAGLGGVLLLGLMDSRRVAYLLVALSAIGVIAYGGLAVGTVAGVLAGWLVLRSRGAPSPAPTEWSGSLPTGVPPVRGASKRSLTDRPPVTEWSGIFATAPNSPPGRGRGRVALPTADRLAAALAKGRAASLRQGAVAAYPPAIVVLPPPPVGLRGLARPSGVGAGPGGRPSPLAPVAPAHPRTSVSPFEAGAVPPGTPSPLVRRWKAETAEISPWATPKTPVAPPEPVRPAVESPATPTSVLGEGIPTVGEVASAETPSRPTETYAPAARPAPAVPGAEPSALSGRPYLGGPLRAPLPRAPAAPAPAAGPSGPAAAAMAADHVPELVAPVLVSRPPPPSVPLAKGRTRAWRCPNCQLINAPWTPRCTKCKAEPPSG